ncbi:dihydrolipoyl dehydrogenase family protein [Listeria costaricensis]|uniref:dihydrolipoyl dehydrogenase family protein n=1 Tax=Listeria costaricensis TaxID=2026604 RepID=UPI000C08756D|nr:NAD(P)/FAD-dependent oxidoreductase [Listeria costaricensis]
MELQFDCIVVGSGVSGTQVAFSLREVGQNVAIIEEREIGGTCVLRGCDPKKVLAGAMEAYQLTKRLTHKGIKQAAQIDWEELMAFKETFVKNVPHDREKQFAQAGIEVFKGTASFSGSDSLTVGENQLSAKTIILATGARPAVLSIEGKEFLQTSDDFLELPHLPKRMAFIGGGYIAFEFAAIARAAGSEVAIVHHNQQPLKGFDPDHVALLVEKLQEEGVTFHFDTEVTKITQESTCYKLQAENWRLEVDQVFCTAGRIPNIEKLQLEKANIQTGKRGIKVDDNLLAAPGIYACGDVADTKGAPLTPVDSFEAARVVDHILGRKSPSYPPTPSAVFSSPKLARIGIRAFEAKKAPARFHVNEVDLRNWYTYRRTNEQIAFAKIITERATGQVAGVELISEEADVLINYFALIMAGKLTAEHVENLLFAYPSPASDLTSLLTKMSVL